MDDTNSREPKRTLVVGYGNSLRGDDAVGQHVARGVSNWNLPGVTVLAVHQLTVELAEPLSRADVAIFVDAAAGELRGQSIHRQGRWKRERAGCEFPVHKGSAEEAVLVLALDPADRNGTSSHTSDPKGLLALAQSLYGHHPAAWLVTVRAVDFSLREHLSTTASRGVAVALAQIAGLLQNP